jgi:predicted PurR-regulated permease PerM
MVHWIGEGQSCCRLTEMKPLLMGKGSTVPMLVIFLGAIGGFIFSGLIGLFTGAIVLSVGYNLMVHWIGEGQS